MNEEIIDPKSILKGQCNIFQTVKGVSLGEDFNFLSNKKRIKHLDEGSTLSAMTSFVGNETPPNLQSIMDKFVNLSYYKNESKENNVPHIDIYDKEQCKAYTIVMEGAMWVLPDVNAKDITPKLIASYGYSTGTFPETCQIWSPGRDEWVPEDNQTFRFTKTIISFFYDMTIQMHVSDVPEEEFKSLSQIYNIKVDRAIIFERTKRNRQKIDSTAKVKSIFMLHQLEEGVLISQVTALFNTYIPAIIANILPTFHESAAKEVAETAEKTRTYFYAKKMKRKKKISTRGET